jgi:hypothetical protein
MDELMNSENAMTSFQAAKFALAVGADIAPPERPAIAVSINASESVGYVIDLTGRPVDRPHAATGPPVIEGEASEIEPPE